jgi:hypothetical protein
MRRTPLRRRTSLRTSKEKRSGRRDTGPDRTTRELVLERDDYRCAVCGDSIVGGVRSIHHHRRNRGSGGSSDPAINAPSNLLTVCGDGTSGCHGWIGANPDEAMDAGFAVSLNSSDAPAQVPVDHAVYGLVYLRDDGEFDFPSMRQAAAESRADEPAEGGDGR